MEAPSIEIFEEMKSAAIAVWQTFDNTHGYVTETSKTTQWSFTVCLITKTKL